MGVFVPSTVSAGFVDYFAASVPPAGWLECNGAAISRTTYAALFLAIGTTFGAGDGSTTFNIPDCRGEFLRGWDNGRGVDSARALGSAQGATSINNYPNNNGAATTSDEDSVVAAGSSLGPDAETGVSRSKTAFTVRPRNVAMLTCIKF